MTNKQQDLINTLTALSNRIHETMWFNETNEWRRYQRFHMEDHLSPSKKNQYKLALSRAFEDAKKQGKEEIHFFEGWKIRFFIITEWIMEDWAIRHGLNYKDYNLDNPFSPQDCKVEGVDIDVKTTVGLGKLQAIPFQSKKGDLGEIQVAVKSQAQKPRNKYFSDHNILGIFDASRYSNIKINLKYITLKKQVKNPCYFQPLEHYFNLMPKISHEKRSYDKEVIENCLNSDAFKRSNKFIGLFNLKFNPDFTLIAIILTMLESPKQLQNFLEEQLPDIHHDFIPIVLELTINKSIQLLPHYLADYLIKKFDNKEEVSSESVIHIIFSIYYPNRSQREYILNLLKISDILPEVRCKWHPEEDIKDMDIKFIDSPKGFPVPIFQVQCPQEPTKRTTFYTYSWKTYETLLYKRSDLCGNINCGGLTHHWPDRSEWSLKVKTICKSGCETHGREAHKKITEEELRLWKRNAYDDDIPF